MTNVVHQHLIVLYTNAVERVNAMILINLINSLVLILCNTHEDLEDKKPSHWQYSDLRPAVIL